MPAVVYVPLYADVRDFYVFLVTLLTSKLLRRRVVGRAERQLGKDSTNGAGNGARCTFQPLELADCGAM